MLIAPPPINSDFFTKIQDEAEFSRFVLSEFEYEASQGALKPICVPDLMHDAYQSYLWDIERLDGNMPRSSSPNHFKSCGYLAYWLRRNSPIMMWEETEKKENLSDEQKFYRDVTFELGRAYHAFKLGYGICRHFEMHQGSSSKSQFLIDMDYIKTICYLMKYKNVSPHAMGVIYRSLFFA